MILTTFFLSTPNSQAEELLNGPVDTLDTIEVPATAVIKEKRKIEIPLPATTNLSPLPNGMLIQSHADLKVAHHPEYFKVVRDSIADIRGVRKPVRPAKAERPPYPQFAREQGWEGTVVLRIRVKSDGRVDAIRTRTSSGYSILDESAHQAVKNWTFEPAKDGEFPIPVTVDLPIRFDLDE